MPAAAQPAAAEPAASAQTSAQASAQASAPQGQRADDGEGDEPPTAQPERIVVVDAADVDVEEMDEDEDLDQTSEAAENSVNRRRSGRPHCRADLTVATAQYECGR